MWAIFLFALTFSRNSQPCISGNRISRVMRSGCSLSAISRPFCAVEATIVLYPSDSN
ncbi:hypothetical protein MBAV_004826 [Candidatus Magnetobacterium bavaricum]|uniref:Uncharacterized protein n=1 Tax=Candidatus Magnetobacterium bavaricum TaxID=29290 RepID=A0A0F3GM36_9BACT|nr:hypothetical protein MBAV_004826 [Candidatus Magnetobacterium bavaricum]